MDVAVEIVAGTQNVVGRALCIIFYVAPVIYTSGYHFGRIAVLSFTAGYAYLKRKCVGDAREMGY